MGAFNIFIATQNKENTTITLNNLSLFMDKNIFYKKMFKMYQDLNFERLTFMYCTVILIDKLLLFSEIFSYNSQ